MMNEEYIFNKPETNWSWIDVISDKDIDFSDCPEVKSSMFDRAIARHVPSQVIARQNLAVMDESDTWTEEDISDLSKFSLQYVAIIYPDNENLKGLEEGLVL